jgi:hypothetical protein
MPFQTFNYSGGGLGGPALANQYAQINQANELRRRYGTDDPIAIQDIVAQQANQDRMNQLQQAEQIKQQDASAQTDELGRRNRLGLGTLSSMLLDPESALYHYEYDSGQKDAQGKAVYQTPEQLGAKPQMSIGDMNGSAPADLPPQPVALGGLGIRRINAGMQDKLDALSPNASRTLSPEEYNNRLQLQADLRAKQSQADNDARAARDAAKAGVTIATKQADIQAHDVTNTGKSNQIAADMATSATLGISPLAKSVSASRTTTTPDPIKVDVAPIGSKAPPKSYDEFAAMYRAKYPNATDDQVLARYQGANR